MSISTTVARLKRRRTRIVATLGPATRDEALLRALIVAGVDVFRLNFSHGTHAEHGETFGRVRALADELDTPVAVLADLCGPKIRIGRFAAGRMPLEQGTSVVVTVRDVEGGAGVIPSAYRELAGDVRPGDRVLLDDGRLELRVQTVAGTEIACAVVRGGVLTDRKGMNLPGVAVSAPSLTPSDRADAEFALGLGVDFLALSFVRTGEDVRQLRELVDGSAGARPRIIAKIEKPEALAAIDGILELSDGIMVARGDLGVELPPEEVPVAQAELVERARRAGKPAIVATQMLESMIENARPTRAEVSDVSGAVLSGADAVMLSAETAAGAHPLEAVGVMDRVARMAEGYLWERGGFASLERRRDGTAALRLEDAISRATAQLSRDLMVRAVVVLDDGEETLRRVSAGRPQAPILAPSADPRRRRAANLLWGVVPVAVPAAEAATPGELSRTLAQELNLAAPGDHVLEVGGFHHDPHRSAPAGRVVRF
jgi:pyruvate kinase